MGVKRSTTALFAAWMAAGCVQTPETTSAVQPLYGTSNYWKSRDIPVCWETLGDGELKDYLRRTLRGQRSWSHAASVNFVGWKDCGPADDGIRIELDPSGSNRTEYPFGPNGADQSLVVIKPSGSDCPNEPRDQECTGVVLLHEFGHALGFRHELDRPDRDVTCVPGNIDFSFDAGADDPYNPFDYRSIMNYCVDATELSPLDQAGVVHFYELEYGSVRKARDFDGDDAADRLCHDVVDGGQVLAAAAAITERTSLCTGDYQSLYVGDFDGDGRADQLCHDHRKGNYEIERGTPKGFSPPEPGNLKCVGDSEHVLVGDVDGNRIDDLICHDSSSGRQAIDSELDAPGPEFTSSPWCEGLLVVGNFDGKYGDDLGCVDRVAGTLSIDYSDALGRFTGPDWTLNQSICVAAAAQILVGDYNGDGMDDLACHDRESGALSIDAAEIDKFFPLGTQDWSHGKWCRSLGDRVIVGDYNGDRKDELLCHNVRSGDQLVVAVDGPSLIKVAFYPDFCNRPGDDHH